MTKKWMHESAERRQAKLPVLAERYGPLGWGSLYRDVGERAWVKSYRVSWIWDLWDNKSCGS